MKWLGHTVALISVAARAQGPAETIVVVPITRDVVSPAFRIDPAYRPVRATRPFVEIVGAFQIQAPGRLHVAEGYSVGFLPVTVKMSNGSCFRISADYLGGALRNGMAAPSDCRVPDSNWRRPPAGGHQGLRFVNSSWGYTAWADDRAGRTVVTFTRGSENQTILEINMVTVGMFAMNSPDSPYSNISFLGTLNGRDVLVTVGLGF